MIFCSVQDAVILLTLFKYLLSSIVSLLSRTSIDGSIFFYLYYLYCLSIFQRTCCFRFKSGCKGKGFIFNYQTFSEVFFIFSFFKSSLLRKEEQRKRTVVTARISKRLSNNAALILKAGAKVRTLFHILQINLKFFFIFLFKGGIHETNSTK